MPVYSDPTSRGDRHPDCNGHCQSDCYVDKTRHADADTEADISSHAHTIDYSNQSDPNDDGQPDCPINSTSNSDSTDADVHAPSAYA